jgi:hypothetical protein
MRALYKVQISVTLKEQFLLPIAWEQRLVVPKLFARSKRVRQIQFLSISRET